MLAPRLHGAEMDSLLLEAGPLHSVRDDLRPVSDLGWHVIHGETFLDALYRVHEGEDPDMVYAELYANSDQERPQ